MSIHSHIVGEDGQEAKVTTEGAISVVVHEHPYTDEMKLLLPFRQYFTDNGLSTGSNDMQVVASLASPQDFSISAISDRDVYIKTISIEISDAGAALNEFGNISPLTNGVEFCWETQSEGTVIIHEQLQTNWDFVRLCAGNPPFGSGAGAFRANNVSANSEGYIPILDAKVVFGLPWGFKLRKGTQDRLLFRVRDDTTGVDSFDIIGFGVQI